MKKLDIFSRKVLSNQNISKSNKISFLTNTKRKKKRKKKRSKGFDYSVPRKAIWFGHLVEHLCTCYIHYDWKAHRIWGLRQQPVAVDLGSFDHMDMDMDMGLIQVLDGLAECDTWEGWAWVRWWHGGLVYCGIHASEVEKRLVCYWVVFIKSDHMPRTQLYPNPDYYYYYFFIVTGSNQTHIWI